MPRRSVTVTPLSDVVVDGRPYQRLARDQEQLVVIPGIPGDADLGTDAIPERLVRFVGYPTIVSVMLRQENRLIDRDQAFVAGLTQWSIGLDGVLVYCPSTPARDALVALAEAQVAIQKLLTHPVRWQDPVSWRDRLVYYQGAPAIVRDHDGAKGVVLLQAEDGWVFPPSPAAWEAANGQPIPARNAVLVDILSDQIWWHRETPDLDDAATERPPSTEETDD